MIMMSNNTSLHLIMMSDKMLQGVLLTLETWTWLMMDRKLVDKMTGWSSSRTRLFHHA